MFEVFSSGLQGVRSLTASSTQVVGDGVVKLDTTAGAVAYTLLPQSQVPNRELTVVWIAGSYPATIVWPSGESYRDGLTTFTFSRLGQTILVRQHGAM